MWVVVRLTSARIELCPTTDALSVFGSASFGLPIPFCAVACGGIGSCKCSARPISGKWSEDALLDPPAVSGLTLQFSGISEAETI